MLPMDVLQGMRVPIRKSQMARALGKVKGMVVTTKELIDLVRAKAVVATASAEAAQEKEVDPLQDDELREDLTKELEAAPEGAPKLMIVGEGEFSAKELAGELRKKSHIGDVVLRQRRQQLALFRQAIVTGNYEIFEDD